MNFLKRKHKFDPEKDCIVCQSPSEGFIHEIRYVQSTDTDDVKTTHKIRVHSHCVTLALVNEYWHNATEAWIFDIMHPKFLKQTTFDKKRWPQIKDFMGAGFEGRTGGIPTRYSTIGISPKTGELICLTREVLVREQEWR